MKRLNITIPDRLAEELACFPNKSKFIADAIETKLRIIRERQLEQELITGYKASSDSDQDDWERASINDWE